MSNQFDHQNIKVYVRCRPLRMNEQPAVDIDRNEVQFQDGKRFCFDDVFDSESSQDEIYETVARPLVEQVLEGFNCTVFAYGQTGTGKTYTMEGIIPQAIDHIFRILARPNKECAIRVSFLELYNDECYDLLTDDCTRLKIFDDVHRKGSVHGMKEVNMVSKDDIIEILRQGTVKRQTNATLLNACSSRSHTIFTINLRIKENNCTTMAKLNLVDLAGSESVGRSGAKDKVAREAGNINQSLLTLGKVFTALTEGRTHIPYRESKLTRILQDSLGGATRTSMIATISPADIDTTNTLSTLEYASRARGIRNQPEANKQVLQSRQAGDDMNVEMRVRNEVAAEFKREIAKMKQSFEAQSTEMKNDYEKSIQEYEALLVAKERELKIVKELAEYRNTLVQDLEEKLQAREMEIKNLEEQLETRMSDTPEDKKAARIRTKAPITDECGGDYANMTFEGCDEIAVVSAAKKTRKKVGAGTKKRVINPAILLSGKKKKLKNNESDTELSPVQAPTTRVTRSRASKRKLNF